MWLQRRPEEIKIELGMIIMSSTEDNLITTPRCEICLKEFKKISKYIYKPLCKHFKKGMRLCIG